jgi:hypothetical protein
MSTSFYFLRPPVTSLRVTKPSNYSITLWLNKESAGTVVVREAELTEFLLIFRGKLAGVRVTGRVIWEGGESPVGKQLISEYGELFRVRAEGVLEEDGYGRT